MHEREHKIREEKFCRTGAEESVNEDIGYRFFELMVCLLEDYFSNLDV